MQAMQTALTALSSHQRMLEVAANNLANINTPSFKAQDIKFADLFYHVLSAGQPPSSSRGGSSPIEVGLGTQVAFVQTRFTQGIVHVTGNPTDLAILGNGFFVLRRDNATLYTRDGAFRIDANGRLVHAGTGAIAQGWLADADGNVNESAAITDIVLPLGMTLAAKATSSVKLVGNLDSEAQIGAPVKTNFFVFDSLGSKHLIELELTKTSPNTWAWKASLYGNNAGSGVLSFSPEGNLTSSSGFISIMLTNGAASPQQIRLDFSHVTQLASTATLSMLNQDGFQAGSMSGISIDSHGNIVGAFTNGLTKRLAKLALATFTNPAGLHHLGSNLYSPSSNSGLPKIEPACVGAAGTIQSGALELSNVDLAEELARVLIAQRGFQASARVITAADELIHEALNIRR